MKHLFEILAASAALLVLSACSTTQVSNFKLDATPSPEVRGPGTHMEDMSGMARASVSFTKADEDEVSFPVRSRALDENLKINLSGSTVSTARVDSVSKAGKNDAFLKIDGMHISGAVDFFLKFSTLFVQFGVGAYDGMYYYASIGANYRFFEFGAFIGEFHQFSTVHYLGYWCGVSGCSEEERSGSFESNELVVLTDAFGGGYIGAHIWRFSLNNTISVYVPGLDVRGLDYDMPTVISNYTSLGLRLGDNWTLRGGTVATFIRNISKPHFGLKFSIDYSVGGGSESSKKSTPTTETPVEYKTEVPAEPQPEPEAVEANEAGAADAQEPPAETVADENTEPVSETETAAEAETVTDSAENSAEEPAETESGESSETSEE